MKCIKLVKEIKGLPLGSISRVNDLFAHKKVSEGFYGYVSKSEWREYHHPGETLEKERKNFPANVEGTKEFNVANEKARKEDKKSSKKK